MTKRTRLPAPPIHGTLPLAREWLESLPFDTSWISERLEFMTVYTSQSFEPGDAELREVWPQGAAISWLGGPAAGITAQQWPRRTDGRPLAHVASFDLSDQVIDTPSRPWWGPIDEGLPTTGILQVFHDLETYGYDARDRDAAGWLIRWLPDPDRTLLCDPPSDVDTPTRACQAMIALSGWSPPSPMDTIGAPSGLSEAVEKVTEAVTWMWSWQRTGNQKAAPLPVTHLYGHSQAGDGLPLEEILPAALPLTEPNDRYRLIADIESRTALNGWFGDASPLEVWMRQSDLDHRRFHNAWCIIRTD